MPPIPRDPSFDATLALLADPYRFIQRRCRQLQSDLFQTRLMLETTICMSGPEAAALFYDTRRFVRAGAAPRRIRKTLFGEGGVQTLDDDAHRHRKAMFLPLLEDTQVQRLADTFLGGLDAYAHRWAGRRVVLYDALQRILTAAVCAWAGVPVTESELETRTRQLVPLFDDAGSVGPLHWRARAARTRANRWAGAVIERIRRGDAYAPDGSIAARIARHRGLDGNLLPVAVAAVELVNVLRPTVAVSVYATLAATALHEQPGSRARIREGDAEYLHLFVQEVRRFYPFFPAVAARVRDGFEWHGYPFAAGTLVMLDLYGTNHDGRVWDDPMEFRPERFRTRRESAFEFVPQGGGDHAANHRCPGEAITIALTKTATRFLASHLTYELPRQDLRIDYTRLPALPRSRMLIRVAALLAALVVPPVSPTFAAGGDVTPPAAADTRAQEAAALAPRRLNPPLLKSGFMGVRHWNETIDGPLSEAALRRKLEAAGYLVARYTYPPGTAFPDHVHDVDKIDAVVSGRFRMVVAGHLAVLGPGDWVEVARGVRHSASVIGDEPVVSLDAVRRPSSAA